MNRKIIGISLFIIVSVVIITGIIVTHVTPFTSQSTEPTKITTENNTLNSSSILTQTESERGSNTFNDGLYVYHPDAEYRLSLWYGPYVIFTPDTKNVEELLDIKRVQVIFQYADEDRKTNESYWSTPPYFTVSLSEGQEIITVLDKMFPDMIPSQDEEILEYNYEGETYKTPYSLYGRGGYDIVHDGKSYKIGIGLCKVGCPKLL